MLLYNYNTFDVLTHNHISFYDNVYNTCMHAGYCSLDGLEKVTRPMCALPKSRVVAGQDSETKLLNIVQCCPETPMLGGKSKIPSKYCSAHSHLDEHTTNVSQISCLPPELDYIRSKAADEVTLPYNDDNSLLIACKKATSINRFYDRTAGIMALERPCGIIVNFSEMYTCESPTQCYVFLYTTFGRSLDDLARLKYLGYDRTCDLHPFLKNLMKKGSLGAKILLENVKFMVDLWHCQKHKEATCMPPNNPNCVYHPHLPAFKEIHGVNSECAEQAFKWLGKFKFISRRMTRPRFCFFLWNMIELHNQWISRRLSLVEQ